MATQPQQNNSRVPAQLRAGIAALLVLTGAGTGTYIAVSHHTSDLQRHEYVQAVAADTGTSLPVKLAMVMAAYYESSYKHIGTPYVDKLGKGRPLTVCAGITGAGVTPGRVYSPVDCYLLERSRYLSAERWLIGDVPQWHDLPVFTRATVLDFTHNKGTGAFAGSTLRRKLVAGDLQGACAENPRWNRGTVNGVSTVLPGLQVRGGANAEICLWGDPLQAVVVVQEPTPEPLPVEVAPAPTPTPEPLPWWRRIFTRSAA